MKPSYACDVIVPSCSFFRAARTSAVWGNEPIVVVGKSGRRSCRCRRAACGEARRMSFSLTPRSEEHTSELQSLAYLVCRLLLEKKKKNKREIHNAERSEA